MLASCWASGLWEEESSKLGLLIVRRERTIWSCLVSAEWRAVIVNGKWSERIQKQFFFLESFRLQRWKSAIQQQKGVKTIFICYYISHTFRRRMMEWGRLRKKDYKNVGLKDSADTVFFLHFFQGTLLVNLLLNMNVRKKAEWLPEEESVKSNDLNRLFLFLILFPIRIVRQVPTERKKKKRTRWA